MIPEKVVLVVWMNKGKKIYRVQVAQDGER